jgi:hypothetical protein
MASGRGMRVAVASNSLGEGRIGMRFRGVWILSGALRDSAVLVFAGTSCAACAPQEFVGVTFGSVDGRGTCVTLPIVSTPAISPTT